MFTLMRERSKHVFLDLRCRKVQEICNKNYNEFCNSMSDVIEMRHSMRELGVGAIDLADYVGSDFFLPRRDIPDSTKVGFALIFYLKGTEGSRALCISP